MFAIELTVNDIFMSKTIVKMKAWEYIAREIFNIMRVDLDEFEMWFLISGVSTMEELCKYGVEYTTGLNPGLAIRFTIRKYSGGFAATAFMRDTKWMRFVEFSADTVRMNFTPIVIQITSEFENLVDTQERMKAARAKLRKGRRVARDFIRSNIRIMRCASDEPNAPTFRCRKLEKQTGVADL